MTQFGYDKETLHLAVIVFFLCPLNYVVMFWQTDIDIQCVSKYVCLCIFWTTRQNWTNFNNFWLQTPEEILYQITISSPTTP